MKKYLPLLLILCVPLLAVNCKEEIFVKDDKLPEATRTGAETFGCMLNGEVWKTIYTDDITATYQEGFLSINASVKPKGRSEYISFFVSGYIEEGATYSLLEDPVKRGVRFGSFNDAGTLHCLYERTDVLEGSITFTRWDMEEQIASGTFSFKTAKEGCQTIEAKEGRFDVNFIY